jgi:hypothetical protein
MFLRESAGKWVKFAVVAYDAFPASLFLLNLSPEQ